ncbi:nitroreductase family protein [Nocardioides sp. zg-536]|uniref:Nitroreductase family protein n=1 Tax=Nocardioides faecalis TaxID=2803858 RepID=A0A939BWN5_9ACTN|nr:nitroreductase family protein [Nocardioides faecalis]MBM9460827.1 nitroreductase family protein [Nocardioides faecalis]QVI58015.1 nitroreductase family protein [Nocardioides faecalis]
MTYPNEGQLLDLTAQELLHTTRSVRLRLDFDRPVPDHLISECVETALQAPSGSNRWLMQFLVVTDPDKRAAFGEIYRDAFEQQYKKLPTYIGAVEKATPEANESQGRTTRSAEFLADTFHRAPAIVLACAVGRAEGGAPIAKTTLLGSVLPGMWSFMLAARLRGLGTSWTTVGLFQEQRVHDLFGIPIDSVTIGSMSPLAFTKGIDFKPALRPSPDEVIHWNQW